MYLLSLKTCGQGNDCEINIKYVLGTKLFYASLQL